jgi:capsular polysaccharide transport system permease protein
MTTLTDDAPAARARAQGDPPPPKVEPTAGAKEANGAKDAPKAKEAHRAKGVADAKETAKAKEAEAGKAPGAVAKPAAHPAKAPPPAANREAVERLRRERTRRLAVRLMVFVVLPTLLAGAYYGAFATDQYESYSQFTVHSVENRAPTGLDGLLGAFAGGASARDTLVVRDYILSRDMLAKLDSEGAFSSHWKRAELDVVARLAADAGREETFEHFLDQVGVDYDSNSGVLTLRVRATDPETARGFAQSIIDQSEAMVNRLSDRERLDRTRDAEDRVKESEARLSAARQAVLEQQQRHAELNPLATAGATMTVRTSLESELAQARAHLMELRAIMTADAPKVRAASERVKALSAQIGAEKRRLVDPKGSGEGDIAGSLAEFEAAMVEKEFAEASYRSALATLEIARADAARQHRYLAVVSAPSMPDESTHPRRALGVLTVFLMSFLVMGIASLLIASVREHARV